MKLRIMALTLLFILIPMASLAADLTVTFLDVGQADAIFIECDGQTMLVDAGSVATANSVVQFLKEQGVEKIQYLVGTHPHEGHIGGFIKVLEQFAVESVWTARVDFPSELQEATEEAVQNEGLESLPATLGRTFPLGDATVTVVGPVGNEYDVLQNYSVVLRIDHGENSFLLTGDMEAQSELELVDTASEIDVDVLKVGSHGGIAACTPEFLKAVSPSYAVISCGKDMADSQVIAALEQAGATVLRTDQLGNIALVSD
nr:MBL fold metallo-hydrolase [Clostridia bacterium]